MTWYVRRASLHDREELEALCLASVGADDYVIKDLERLILRAVVHVAIGEKDRLVGMMSYRPCLDGSAWLGQARTLPDFRRQGVAHAIIESFVGLARNSRASALRLWTESTNREGMSSFKAAGFQEVGRFARMIGEAAPRPRNLTWWGRPRSSPRPFDEALWQQLAESKIVAKGQGYAHHEEYFLPAARPVVFALAAKGLLHGWDGNLLSFSEDPYASEYLWFTAWDGSPPDLFLEARRFAALYGRSHAQTFLPNDRRLLEEAKEAEYEEGTWGREAVLAELRLNPSNARRRTRPTYGELAARRSTHGHAHGESLGWARWNS